MSLIFYLLLHWSISVDVPRIYSFSKVVMFMNIDRNICKAVVFEQNINLLKHVLEKCWFVIGFNLSLML